MKGTMLWIFMIGPAWAQEPGGNPADLQKKNQPKPNPETRVQDEHTYTVEGKKVSDLKEEDLIGENHQPRWTAARRFTNTRVYVIPPGEIEFEWWGRFTTPRDEKKPSQARYLWEIEMGLPHRVQLDLYLGAEGTGDKGMFDFVRQQLEVRWALADWDEIWGNPTLYLEYVNKKGEADAIEGKLLFGGEIVTGWHWGVNFVWERTIGDQLNNEWQASGGVSYTVIDMLLSVGLELQAIWEDTVHKRGHFDNIYWGGPSVQYRPIPRMHVDLAFLAGFTEESPAYRVWIIMGWEF